MRWGWDFPVLPGGGSQYPAMPMTGGATFAGFRIVRPLGSGTWGRCTWPSNPRLLRREALKILPAEVSADAESGSGSTARRNVLIDVKQGRRGLFSERLYRHR